MTRRATARKSLVPVADASAWRASSIFSAASKSSTMVEVAGRANASRAARLVQSYRALAGMLLLVVVP